MGFGVEVLPIGPVAVASRAWRHRGRRLITAIVKATCTIVHDQPMAIAHPAPIVTEERHYRNNPVASLVRGSDLALVVARPEVLILGSAFAAPGQTTPQTTVRLAVQRDSTIILNKRLEIFGDRRAKPGAPPPEAIPFAKMPILYERARGGMAARDNPVGVGMAIDPDGLLTLPNVNLPSQGGFNPAGLGPIPSAWPLRQKKRGSLGWTQANLSTDVDVPDDFDEAYYQTAPADQQTQELLPGDLIAIVNMHPELAMLRTYLPKMRGLALAQTARGDRLPLNLRMDTVHLEPDLMRAEIVFRGATMIEESQLVNLRLAGTIEQLDMPFSFPDLSSISGLVTRARSTGPSLDSTAVIGESPDAPDPRGALFQNEHPLARGGTMVMEKESALQTPHGAPKPLPAAGRPPPPAPPPPANRPANAQPGAPLPAILTGTLTDGDGPATIAIATQPAPRTLPFERSQPPNKTAQSREATPWASEPPAPAPPWAGASIEDELTIDVPEDMLPRLIRASQPDGSLPNADPTKQVDSESAETPRREPEKKAEAPADPYGAALRELPSEKEKEKDNPPALAPVAPVVRANLKQDMYKKLKR